MNELEVPDAQAGNILAENQEVKEKEAKQGTFQIFNYYRAAIILLQMRIRVFHADLLLKVLFCVESSADFLLSLNAIKIPFSSIFFLNKFNHNHSNSYYKIIKNK